MNRNRLCLFAAALVLASCTSVPGPQTPVASSSLGSDKTNVILMISDGIGFNGWLATDYYQGLAGQQTYQVVRPDGTEPIVYGMSHTALNVTDAAGNLITRSTDAANAVAAVPQIYDPTTRWDDFQNTFRNDFAPIGASYTSYTDSAAAGTALMTGQKTANGRINMDWRGEDTFETIAEIAMDRGFAAGAVSSVMASHATPAAVIAHNEARRNYDEIFDEMVASDLAVIMGGGHPLYDDSGKPINPSGEKAYQYVGGSDTLTALTSEAGLNGFTFIDAKSDFEALARGTDTPSRVVGIARTGSTLQASREGLGASAETVSGMAFNPDVPDLATMSLGALNVLDQDPDGFFLMIEGGAVDWMGHANNMPRFIEEQIDFNQAVDAVIEWVETESSWDNTLLIITADHETGGIWGEGTWTNSEGGFVAASRDDDTIKAARFDPAEDMFNDFLAVQDRGAGALPGYQFASGNHTNELVPLWAIGKGADRLTPGRRLDRKAAELWGEPYGWEGLYVDNVDVFALMEDVLDTE